ncbi:MAG: hypothetical protein QM433_05930, partial [Euryarchaeota archaeon]|nr:hypothetical protein [Methanothrix harundinacea]MDI9399071.1 hypothetical protein [Euryarchaeota archaeon]
PWLPRYVITPATARTLMEIEAARAVVDETPLPLAAEAKAPPPGPPPLDPSLHPDRWRWIHLAFGSARQHFDYENRLYREKHTNSLLRWSLGRCRAVCC